MARFAFRIQSVLFINASDVMNSLPGMAALTASRRSMDSSAMLIQMQCCNRYGLFCGLRSSPHFISMSLLSYLRRFFVAGIVFVNRFAICLYCVRPMGDYTHTR